MDSDGGDGEANAGHSCPETVSFSDIGQEAGEITINGQRMHVVQASDEEQEAIQRILEGESRKQKAGSGNQKSDVGSQKQNAETLKAESGGQKSEVGGQELTQKSNPVWKAAGTKLVGVLFLMAAVGAGLACGLVQHTAECAQHGTGHCGHKPVPVKATSRRSHTGKRRYEDELNAELRVGNDEPGLTRQRGECEIRAENCPYRMPDGWCRLTGRRCRLFVGTSEVRKMLAELRREKMERPDSTPPNDNEAARVFALMKSLDAGDRVRKATLHRVFRLLVLDGLSQNAAARKCQCSASLISLRSKEIERRMNLPVTVLRTLASRVGELASVDDSRARKIYRKGLTDDTALDDG